MRKKIEATDVEIDLEPGFDAMASAAEKSGWSEHEVANALLNLALARVLALYANLDTEQAIKRASRSVHGIEQ